LPRPELRHVNDRPRHNARKHLRRLKRAKRDRKGGMQRAT
jgi:hypothetical protein